jgi:hypothetical protein
MDCFAEPVIGRRFAPTRWLAMTVGEVVGWAKAHRAVPTALVCNSQRGLGKAKRARHFTSSLACLVRAIQYDRHLDAHFLPDGRRNQGASARIGPALEEKPSCRDWQSRLFWQCPRPRPTHKIPRLDNPPHRPLTVRMEQGRSCLMHECQVMAPGSERPPTIITPAPAPSWCHRKQASLGANEMNYGNYGPVP